LVAVILLGLFFDFDKNPTAKYILGGFAIIGFVIILFQSFGGIWGFGFGYGFPFFGNLGWWLQQNLGWILTVLLVVGGIIAVIMSGKKKKKKKKKFVLDDSEDE